jgi:predicted dienelactone hydrolase
MAYDAPGPNKTVTEAGGEACTIVRPEALGQGGARHPVVLWGNGTGQRPAGYRAILENLASWGFIAAAANTTNAGTGVEVLSCLDWLTAENSRQGSPYQGKVDTTKVGTSGHSQGGGGSIMAGRDPRVKATAPVQPYTLRLGYVAGAQKLQHGPMLMTSGGADTIARPDMNQQIVFDEVNQPIFWATLKDSSH